MFFGRVDVYWPDRPVESHRLTKETVAVGRSTGNDIVLDTTTISRYHITLTVKNQQTLLEDLDSVNGTYVDGARLQAHTPFVLRGGEEIQIGEVRLIFHPPGVSEQTHAEDTTQRIVLSQLSFRIELDGPEMAVAPGAHVQAVLTIENLGNEPDRYSVEIEGLPKGWARADRMEAPLEPGEDTQVMISFKPLRRSESKPGDHPVVIRVRSVARPSESLDIPTVLHVLPYSGFGMALSDMHITDETGFKLYLHNQGNAPLPLTLQGTDSEQALNIPLSGAQVQLGPGERRTLAGTIAPRRPRWFGPDHLHEFAIIARAQDASGFLAAIPGKYTEKSRFPGWVPVLVIPLVAVLALLIIGGGLLLLRGGDDVSDVAPTIHAFVLDADSVALGEQVLATWDIVGAETAVLRVQSVRGQYDISLDPDADSHYVTFDQTGVYSLVLEAQSGSARSTATAMVEVTPMATLVIDVLGGTELVRNVQHDVRIRWSVAGARESEGGYTIWLESSSHDTPLLVAPMPLTGEQIVTLMITSEAPEWSATLYAEGYDQVTTSAEQRFGVVFPICELAVPQTVVRSGPGEAYPAIMPPQPTDTSPGETLSYSPVARDPSGAWLRVTVSIAPTRLGWVPLGEFNCTNFDPDRLVVTEDFPPPPAGDAPVEAGSTIPAPTASPAASPTPQP